MSFRALLIIALLLLLPCVVQATLPAPLQTSSAKQEEMQPFGTDLFQGNFAQSFFDGLNNEYRVMPGDRVKVQIWGAQTFDGILEVDARGNLFLPEIGPVRVEGLRLGELENSIQQKVRSVFTRNVDIYVNLLRPQPVSVFVAGFVTSPGRYAGGPTDSVLYYLDLAGGIDSALGSFRDIRILRKDKQLEQIDLYNFMLEGQLIRPRLEEGDVILVGKRGHVVSAEGQVRNPAKFEFKPSVRLFGDKLLSLTSPESKASHVSITGSRQGAPYNVYLPISEFLQLLLDDGDKVRFHADIPGDTIMVAAEGAIVGASRYPVKKSTRLKELLSYISIEPELANLDGLHIRRKSVAAQQKKALEEALQRLEQSSLTATSSSVDEASIRVREAELIAKFVEKARQITPGGTVVIGQNGEFADIYLENGDEIIIPAKSDVVMISGEVLMPQAIVFAGSKDVDDYIASTGGFSKRADKKHVLVVKPNGQVLQAKETSVAAGDQILVLPRFDSKNMQVLKDISQILYQVAVAAKVALDL